MVGYFPKQAVSFCMRSRALSKLKTKPDNYDHRWITVIRFRVSLLSGLEFEIFTMHLH